VRADTGAIQTGLHSGSKGPHCKGLRSSKGAAGGPAAQAWLAQDAVTEMRMLCMADKWTQCPIMHAHA
jgi:hypothetical protein